MNAPAPTPRDRLLVGLLALLVLATVASGLANLALVDPIPEVMARIGMPAHLARALGVLKIGAAATLTVLVWVRPRPHRLAEWAFAGLAFNFLGATYAHLATPGDAASAAAPAALLALTLATHARHRRAHPWVPLAMGTRSSQAPSP